MARVFLSYRRSDTEKQVAQLKDEIEKQGTLLNKSITLFFDKHDIKPGEDWKKKIQDNIESADVVLVLIGKTWVRTLHERALYQMKPAWVDPLVGVLHENLPPTHSGSTRWIHDAITELRNWPQDDWSGSATKFLYDYAMRYCPEFASPEQTRSLISQFMGLVQGEDEQAVELRTQLQKLERQLYSDPVDIRAINAELFEKMAMLDQLSPSFQWAQRTRQQLRSSMPESLQFLQHVTSTLTQRELANPQEDFVRYEVRTALNRDMLVVPVLINGATMPQESDLPVDLHELCQRHACWLDPAAQVSKWAEQIVQILHELPILSFLQAELQTIRPRLQELETRLFPNDQGENNFIRDLIDGLEKQSKIIQRSKDRGGHFYHLALVDIIIKVGSLLYEFEDELDTQSFSQQDIYVFRQLNNLLQFAAESLAQADQDLVGYRELRVIAVERARRGRSRRYAAERGLAYYHEVRRVKNFRLRPDESVKPPLWKQLAPGQLRSKAQKQWEKRSLSSHMSRHLIRHTWQEFISAEVIGGLIVAMILAVALATHSTVSLHYMTSLNYSDPAVDPMMCWETSEKCREGLLLDGVSLLLMFFLGLGGATLFQRLQSSRDIHWWTYVLLILGIAGVLSIWVYLGLEYGDNTIKQFLAIGLATLPGSVIFLTAVSWSSVLIGARKTRQTPEVQMWITMIATMLGMVVNFFLFAAIVEKSRYYLWESIRFGALWGLALGFGLWLGRSLAAATFNQKNNQLVRVMPTWSHAIIRRFAPLFVAILFSVAFTLLVGRVLDWWPYHNQFLAISRIPQDQIDARPALGDFQSSIKLVRFGMLGLWFAIAMYFGMDALSGKMCFTGEIILDDAHEKV